MRLSSRAVSILQVDWVRSVWDWLAVRTSSRASSLPQWDWVASVGDWLAGRPSSLASQLPQGLGGVSWGLVGWQAVIAGKPAPTVGLGGVSWGLVGWQAVIAGKPAPTGIGGGQLEVGRLAGRLREQARSHRFNMRTTQAAKPPHSTG